MYKRVKVNYLYNSTETDQFTVDGRSAISGIMIKVPLQEATTTTTSLPLSLLTITTVMTLPSYAKFLVLASFLVCSTVQGFAPASHFSATRQGAFAKPHSAAVPTRISTARPALLNGAVGEVGKSLFRSQGTVPVLQSLGLNMFLFTALSKKLSTMLTPTAFAHTLGLATVLWHSLGWRGWSTCVAFLFCGQIVTKVKFAEKEAAGIAEKRGGRRGPENVWYVCGVCVKGWMDLPEYHC
jgi:hypothetical protein